MSIQTARPRGADDAGAAGQTWYAPDDIPALGLPQREAALLAAELRSDNPYRRRFAESYIGELRAARAHVGDVHDVIDPAHARIDNAGVIVAGILRRIGGAT